MRNWSRKKKLALWILILFLAVILLIFSTEFPSLTAEMAMRKAEKQQLVGPSEIVGYEDISYWFSYDKAIIGKTGYGYCLFEYHVSDASTIAGTGKLTYHEKGKAITLFTSSRNHPHVYMEDLYLPVFMFCENSKADHAEIELFTQYQAYRGDLTQNTYLSEANRSSNGYFLFKLDLSGEVDLYSVDYIQERLSSDLNSYPGITGTATIRLFDKTGELLETHVLDLNNM